MKKRCWIGVLLFLIAISRLRAEFPIVPLTLIGVNEVVGAGRHDGDTYGGAIDFRLGRDNLGFPNLSGVVQTGGMAGNCYAMAFVTKRMFERSTYRNSDRSYETKRGFTLDQLATVLKGPATGKVTAEDFASLYDMTSDPTFDEGRAMAYIQQQTRRSGPRPTAVTGRQLMILRMMQLVTSVHYLHYLQVQAPSVVDAVVAGLVKEGTAPKLTDRSLDSIKKQLGEGKTCMICMWNTAVSFGHVILAYKMEVRGNTTDIYVYDNNLQYAGGRTTELVLRVEKDGEKRNYKLLEKKPEGLVPDTTYDGSDFFTRAATLSILHLPDLTLAKIQELGEKIGSAEVNAAQLMAVHSFLLSLTTQAPDKRSLREDIRSFLMDAQEIVARPSSLTSSSSTAPSRITSTSTPREINQFLEANTEIAMKTVVPFALPSGISLEDTHLMVSAKDANRAYLETTLKLSATSPLQTMLDIMSRSSLLRGCPDIGLWASAVRDIVRESALSAHVKLLLTKAAMPRLPSTFSPQYGVLPELRFCHAVVGNIKPSKGLENPFQVEISKEILKNGVAVVVQRTQLTKRDFTFDYFFPTGTARRGDFKINSLDVDLRDGRRGKEGYVDISAQVETHPLSAGTGYSWTITPKISVQCYRDSAESLKPNQWRIAGSMNGDITANGTLERLMSGTLSDIATAVFPALSSPINSYVDTQLRDFFAMPAPISITKVAVGPRSFTTEIGPGTIDFESLTKKYLMIPAQVQNNAEIRQIRVTADRLVLGGRATR
jgi:hypothetical protein